MRQLSKDERDILDRIQGLSKGKPIKTAIYARKSTKDLSGSSIDTQIKTCSEFAKRYNNYFDVEHILSDEDKSGMFVENREKFGEVIELLDNMFIVIYK